MNEALKILALTDDIGVIRAFDFLETTLNKAIQNTAPGMIDDIIQECSSESKSFKQLMAVFNTYHGKSLNDIQSVRYARQILVSALTDQKAAPLVRYVLENWPDDRQAVGKILSVGCVGAVWMILMTVDGSVENGDIKINKRPLLPEKIEFESEKFNTKFNIDFIASKEKSSDCIVD